MRILEDPRTDEIGGDVITKWTSPNQLGLHLIDVQSAMGNLVDIAGQQGKAFLAKQKKK
ncbi:MAG: hypothetical protein U0Y68_08610 [Blastocatellia bacterium]